MTLDMTGDLFAFSDPEGGLEPSSRDVNRVLRAEREREKELSRQKQRGTAKYERLAREAAPGCHRLRKVRYCRPRLWETMAP